MINRDKPCFEEIQHTADWAIRAKATSPEALFECCAAGMYALLKIDPVSSEPTRVEKVSLNGVDLESLLVAFLAELLFFYENERVVFTKCSLHIAHNQLEGTLYGTVLDTVHEEIKAVTYHQMKIEQDPQGLSVIVVFDV
jgi:SHS2 domain-containing protein